MELPSINGREIVPVRLIPFIAGYELGPTSLTKLLAHKVGLAFPLFRPEDELFAYHLDPQGVPAKMLPKEWDTLVSDVEILEKKFRRQEEFEDELYAQWRMEAVKLLPIGVFVWKEELEDIYRAWRNLKAIGEVRAGSRELNFTPFIERRLLPVLWEGFGKFRPSASRTEGGKLKIKVKNSDVRENDQGIMVGYSDFIDLCRVDDPEDWAPGFRVEIDGVWVVPLQTSRTPRRERAFMAKHPVKDLTKPALAFPCSLTELQSFLEWSSLYGCIDPFDMADFIQEEFANRKAPEMNSGEAPVKKANPKEVESLLKLVIAMATMGYGFDPGIKKSQIPKDIAEVVEQVGLSIDVDTVRKWLKKSSELLPPNWNETV